MDVIFEYSKLTKKHKRMIDSGIYCEFLQESRSSRHDRNPEVSILPIYGIIENIIAFEFDGMDHDVILLQCLWYKTQLGGRNPSLILGDHGFYKVHLQENRAERKDSFVFPSQVEQVFYVSCPEPGFENWAICVPTTPRSRKIVQLHEDSDEDDIEDLL